MVNAPLSRDVPAVLPEKLQITWQLLGLRRWLPRSALRQSAVTKTPTPTPSPSGRRNPVFQEAKVIGQASVQQKALEPDAFPREISRHAEKLDAIELAAFGRLFDFPRCSLLAAKSSDVLWCLPSLWGREDGYCLFNSPDEAELLANALVYVGLETEALLFRHCAAFLGAEAPRFPAEVRFCEQILPSSRGKTLVLCGPVSLRMVMERFLGDNAQRELRMIGCLHPALALRSARGKYRLWADLERIRGSVCLQ